MEIIENFPRIPEPKIGFWRSFVKRLMDYRWWLGIKPKMVTLPPPKMSITAIVPAYNEQENLRNTVLSLVNQSYPLDNILIVDDCSTDNTFAVAKALSKEFINVKVIQTPKNTGTKAQAQNHALSLTNTELFVSVDGDTVLAKNAIEIVMSYFSDRSAFAVCGFVLPQRIETFWERGRMVDYLSNMTLMKPAQNHQGVVLVAAGCFTVFSTKVVRSLGGFNERTLAEDMDLTWEGMGAGYRVYFASNAACYAVDPPTRKIYVSQMLRWFRGFAQCIAVRDYNLFKTSNKLGLAVYFYVLTSFVGIFALPFVFWKMSFNFPLNFLMAMMLEMLVTAMIVLPRAFQYKLFWKTFFSVPTILVITYVNRILFCYSLFLELVMKKKLVVWEKGH